MVNGQKGILQVKEGHPVKVICFELDSKQKNIQRIFIVSNPDKLNHIPVLIKDRLRAQCGLIHFAKKEVYYRSLVYFNCLLPRDHITTGISNKDKIPPTNDNVR